MTNYHGILNKDKVLRIAESGQKRTINATDYFNQAWEMVQKDMGNYVGFGALAMVISGAVGVVPYVGNLLSSIVNSILTPGFSIFTYKKISNESHDFNTFFEGSKFAGNLIIQAFVIGFISLLILSPVLIPFALSYDFGSGQMNEPTGIMLAFMGIFGFIAFIILFYLTTSWIFAPQLIIFAKMSPWEAMEASRKVVTPNFWSIFVLMFLGGIVALVGMLACCIGLFWAIPTINVANYLVFEDIFQLREDLDENEIDDILEHLV